MSVTNEGRPEANRFFASAVRTLGTFPWNVDSLAAQYGDEPAPGSRRANELAAFPGHEAVATAYSLASVAVTSAADHIAAQERSLTEPVMTFAPSTLSRAVLEAATTAMWLLDPTIDVYERLGRSMTWRLEQLKTELVFVKNPDFPTQREAQAHVLERIKQIIAQGRALGIPEVRNKNKELVAFGKGMPPSMANLCERTLGERATYRLLSGVAHGSFWAVRPLALKVRQESTGRKRLEQDLSMTYAMSLVLDSIEWFSKVSWSRFVVNGWDLKTLVSVLEFAYDKVFMNATSRFWRDRGI